MLRRLIKIIRNCYKKQVLLNHKKDLLNNCVTGREFCASPIYKDSNLQLLNVKIVNKTGNRTSIKFGSYCNVSVNIFLNTKGSIEIGDYVYMNFVSMRIDYDLKIGSHCMFGPGVKLWDTDNHPLSPIKRHHQCEYIAHDGNLDSYEADGGDIFIGNDVWIGMDVIILGGVIIGNGSVIAAGSIVTKSIPENVLVAGVPARVIRQINHQ